MTPSDSKAILETIYDEEFGFRLANFSIKPVHVANGMARELTRRSYNTSPLTKTLRRYVRNQRLGVDEERNPGEVILAEYAEAFESFGGTKLDIRRLNRLRALALDVLGADGAVFPDHDKSSFTLTNEHFITGDPSDHRAGLFLARLLTAEPKDRTIAADCIKVFLTSEKDAWTTLALPLLRFVEPREESEEGERASLAARADHLFESSHGQLVSETLRTLRDAYDRLGRFEQTAGSKLNSLRRLVLFGCFAIHVHAISRWSEREPGAPRPPILLDLTGGSVISVRDASRAMLQAAGDAIEGLIFVCFRDHVVVEYGSAEEELEAAVESFEEGWEFKTAYYNYREGGMSALDALTQSMIDEAFSTSPYNKEPPIGAAIELGRRAGFLVPWSDVGRGGKLRKRYTATAEFLETLIAATVEPEYPLDFPEFLNRLRDDFGIVAGRPEDDRILRQNNLFDGQFGPPTAINEEDLRRNVEKMQQLVVESGYAKAYADGRTVVTTRPEGIL